MPCPEVIAPIMVAISAQRNLANIYRVSIQYAKCGRLLWFLQMRVCSGLYLAQDMGDLRQYF